MRHVVRPRLLLAVIALMAVTSCGGGGGSDTTGPPAADAAVGVYTLSTINGQQLPVIVEQSGNDKVEITQGVVTLKEDRTFSDVTQLRVTIGANVTSETETATGSWTRQANTVQLNPTGFTAYSMTWDGGNRLTQLIATFTLIYTK